MEVGGMNRDSDTGAWLSNQIELLRFEKKDPEIQRLLNDTKDELYRERSPNGSLIGSSFKPVSELRGWENLRAQNLDDCERDGSLMQSFVLRQTPSKWNGWWIYLINAEASLFKDQKQIAIKQVEIALSTLPKKPNFAVSLYARARAARIYAWAGADDAAMDLLEGLASGYPGLGPAAIVRDPFYELPLRNNARWQRLKIRLETDLAAVSERK
jgi:hypothetical protein